MSICERSEQFTAEAGEAREGGLFSVDFCKRFERPKGARTRSKKVRMHL
jgi:hypothetical protein